MRLYHFTSASQAQAIMESGKFNPASQHPLNNDNGLNCFAFRSGYRLGQCFEGTGAKLIMEWTGPIVTTNQNASPPLAPDVLHDQHPWRCFVRGGSKTGLLFMTAIRFDKETIDAMVPTPNWHKHLPQFLQRPLYSRARLELLKAIRRKYRNVRFPLEVCG